VRALARLVAAIALPVALITPAPAASGTNPGPAHEPERVTRAVASHQPGAPEPVGRRAVPLRRAHFAAAGGGSLLPESVSQAGPSVAVSVSHQGLVAGGATPSDSTGSIGPIHYMEIVNVQLGMFDRGLSAPLATVALTTFLGTAAGLRAGDPQIQWDQQAGRWLYAAVEFSGADNQVAFGWSKAGDASALTLNNADWCNFHDDTAANLYDYPKLGHDANFIEVGANVYTSGGAFANGALLAIHKPIAGDTTCTAPSVAVFNLGSTFTPVPANTTDGSSTAYVVAINPAAIGVWHVSPVAVGACAAPPCLVVDGSVAITPWTPTPDPNTSFQVPQPAGNPNIDALDGRLTQAVQHGDPSAGGAEGVWTQHTTGSPTGRTVVTWYELSPTTCSGGICGAAALRQEGVLSSPSLYLFNAAISPTSHGDAAVIQYNTGSASTFVDVRAQSRDAADPPGTMSGELVVRGSAVPDKDFSCFSPVGPPCRWGDYAGASPDPTDCSLVWGSSMLSGTVDAGGASPTWVTQNFAVGEGALRTASSTKQYALSGSDGQAWNDVDPSLLRIASTPCVDKTAVISANADLFTSTRGVNQDLGVFVDVDGVPATAPAAWKESGGGNGTFSPNAAYVETVVPMPAGHTYTVRLKWKANAPTSGTIYAGAGPLPAMGYSPTRLTIRTYQPPPATARITTQQKNTASDGVTWVPIPGISSVSLTPGSDSRAVLGGNADLWTDTAGLNQDIGITVNGTLVAWKESGGSNGTFSPNAAYVRAVLNLTAGQTYVAQLVWKTNARAGLSAAIYAGAGPLFGTAAYSPTTLTAVVQPAGPNPFANVVSTQAKLTDSDGSTWAPFGLQTTVSPLVSAFAAIAANADLWTANAGYNQDIAVFVSDNGATVQLLVWKESGGFGGTFSPNAAMAESVFAMTAGHSYTFIVMWKTNHSAAGTGATIYAGAGPITGAYSSSLLSIEEAG
jgi:hypothetical protein